MSLVQTAFDEIKSQGRDKSKIPEAIEVLRDMVSSLTRELGINSIFEGMIEFINDNADRDMLEKEDKIFSETRVTEFIGEIIEFLIDCFEQRVEFMLFFKTCFFNFDFSFKDFRETLFALGQAFKQFQDNYEDEADREDGGLNRDKEASDKEVESEKDSYGKEGNEEEKEEANAYYGEGFEDAGED